MGSVAVIVYFFLIKIHSEGVCKQLLLPVTHDPEEELHARNLLLSLLSKVGLGVHDVFHLLPR